MEISSGSIPWHSKGVTLLLYYHITSLNFLRQIDRMLLEPKVRTLEAAFLAPSTNHSQEARIQSVTRPGMPRSSFLERAWFWSSWTCWMGPGFLKGRKMSNVLCPLAAGWSTTTSKGSWIASSEEWRLTSWNPGSKGGVRLPCLDTIVCYWTTLKSCKTIFWVNTTHVHFKSSFLRDISTWIFLLENYCVYELILKVVMNRIVYFVSSILCQSFHTIRIFEKQDSYR